jgi:hypothetical protein
LAKHLVGLRGSHIGSSPHHVKNLAFFVCTLSSLCARLQDIMANFDVVHFFTREAMSLLVQRAGKSILRFLPCPQLLFHFWWLVLWTGWWHGCGFVTVSSYCQLLHDRLW